MKIETYQFIQTCLVLSSISEIVTEMFFLQKHVVKQALTGLTIGLCFPPVSICESLSKQTKAHAVVDNFQSCVLKSNIRTFL